MSKLMVFLFALVTFVTATSLVTAQTVTPEKAQTAEATASKFNLNTASAEVVAKQLGITLDDAKKIVTQRAKGKFETMDDVASVPGLSEKGRKRIRHISRSKGLKAYLG
jgi:DNA uptake protein ComE-like DNA-binding protein